MATNIRQRLKYSRRALQAGNRSRAFKSGYQCGWTPRGRAMSDAAAVADFELVLAEMDQTKAEIEALCVEQRAARIRKIAKAGA